MKPKSLGWSVLVAALLAPAPPVRAQGSAYALRFFGTGVGPPPAQDRVMIPIDDPPAALDVGGDFTIDFWMRCAAAQNNGTVSVDASQGIGWITGNIIVDRDIYGTAQRGKYGLSIGQAGPTRVLCFGVTTNNSGLSIVGTNNVADGSWKHVAITRVRATGDMRIYVDGRLDASGIGPVGDISYLDNRATSYPHSDPFLVLAAEKHDAGATYPSYSGFLDEFRVWTQALTQAQISNVFRAVIAGNTAGLVAYYRFEEGAGTNVLDSAGRSPSGRLIAGVAGNGEWVARSADTNNTAPVAPPGNQAPIALASAAPDLGSAPLLVQFTGDESSDPDNGPQPLAFAWHFGDGATSSLTSPTHAYTADGAYTARLSVADGALTSSASVLVRVGPTSRLDVASIPSPVALVVNGVTGATPFALTVLAGDTISVEAPTNATIGGTTHVFRCWSDAGAQIRSFPAPAGGLLLRAGYAPAPGGSLAQPVPAADRNAESYAGNNGFANIYDANALCVGRDAGGRYEVALAFPLHVPQGATIHTASISIRATADQSNTPGFTLGVYNTNTIAVFSGGAGPSVTGLHALVAGSVAWTPGVFTAGQTFATPDLALLLQPIVNRADWTSGAFVGITLAATNTSGDHWRCWNNAQSGFPPVLNVAFTTAGGADGDLDGDGMPDDWETANRLDCTSAGDATEDGDGDMMSSREEYIAGTSPTNGLHVPRIGIAPSESSDARRLLFQTVTGRVYQVDVATNLLFPIWTPIATNVPGNGGAADLVHTNPAPESFYRQGIRLAP